MMHRVGRAVGLSAALALVACGSNHHGTTAAFDAGHDVAVPDANRGACGPSSSSTSPTPVDVLTQHNDVARTGQNLNESVLTPCNVAPKTFGKLFALPVDGLVYAQPLIVTKTQLQGATHDVLLVATMHNTVYAFDADAGGAPLWSHTLGPSVPSNYATVFNGRQNIQVEVGILSTPVIDRDHGYVYLARADYTGGQMAVKVHVLSLATGMDEPGSPATVSSTVPGVSGPISFDPHYASQRPSLLLMNGTVYVAFASYGDMLPYYGWVFGYTYAGGKLTKTQTFISTPGSNGGGFWNSGQGLVSDGQSIYGVTSNGAGAPTTNPPSFTHAFLKLAPSTLALQDWFVPYQYDSWNHGADLDLGSGGPLLIPGTSPQLIVGGGKTGTLYVVDTTNMGHLGTTSNHDVQDFTAVAQSIYGSPVVWTGDGSPRLYIWGTGDVLKEYVLSGGKFDETPAAMGPVETLSDYSQDPAGILSVSSNGSETGTGIVWGVKPLLDPDHLTVAGTFYAFDALTLQELWSSDDDPGRDGFGDYAKFVPPTVANGKVYLATHSKQVVVYGLLAGAGGGA